MIHKDRYGIIGQIQRDGSIEGGDSANWMGHYVYLTRLNKPDFVKTFEISPGAYVRHPVAKSTNNGFGAYYKNPWNGCISRDQLTGILMGIIATKDTAAARRLVLNHALRGFLFTYNTIKNGENPKTAKWKLPDFTGPDIWALELRALISNRGQLSRALVYPLLCILDMHMLVSVVIDNWTGGKKVDVLSSVGKLLVGNEVQSTIVSRLAFRVADRRSLIKRIRGYWCGWRKNCSMYYWYVIPLSRKV